MGPERRWPKPADLEKDIEGYFAWAKKAERPFSKVGMAVHLKISRQGLWQYQQKPGYDKVMEYADARIEDYLVHRVLTGDSKTVGGPIFILKCHHGYHETQRIEHDGVLEVKITKFASDAAK